MGKAMEILEGSVAAFDLSAQDLLGRYAMDAELQGKLQKFIYGCRCSCTANLQWRLAASILIEFHFSKDTNRKP